MEDKEGGFLHGAARVVQPCQPVPVSVQGHGLILHVTQPAIDLGAIQTGKVTPTWLTAISPHVHPASDIRNGSMTLIGDPKNFTVVTKLLELHLPGAVVRRRVPSVRKAV